MCQNRSTWRVSNDDCKPHYLITAFLFNLTNPTQNAIVNKPSFLQHNFENAFALSFKPKNLFYFEIFLYAKSAPGALLLYYKCGVSLGNEMSKSRSYIVVVIEQCLFSSELWYVQFIHNQLSMFFADIASVNLLLSAGEKCVAYVSAHGQYINLR